MKGVKFGDYHSYDDFSLILNSKSIEAPSAKTETIDLPGADGVLDVSEYFGEIKYKNRKLSFEFSTIIPHSEFINHFSDLQNLLHGQKLNIVLDDDPDFYYVGRVTINQWKSDKNIGKVTIDCDCEPYKYKLYKTSRVSNITDNATLTFPNLRKSVVPTIKTTASISIEFDGSTYSLSAGTYTDPAIVFEAGNNLMTVTGTTTLTVEYQEGGL